MLVPLATRTWIVDGAGHDGRRRRGRGARLVRGGGAVVVGVDWRRRVATCNGARVADGMSRTPMTTATTTTPTPRSKPEGGGDPGGS